MVSMEQIPDHPGYFADAWGTIYSTHQSAEPRPLTQFVNGKGYRTVSVGGRNRRVHHLVLEAHGFERPSDRHVTRHLDGDPSNNALANLRWGTHQKNCEDAVLHGTFARGANHGLTQLTEADVIRIRERWADGEEAIPIAADYNITQAAVYAIVKRNTWKHAGGPHYKPGSRRKSPMKPCVHCSGARKPGDQYTFRGTAYRVCPGCRPAVRNGEVVIPR